PSASITATFSRALDPATITSSSFTIVGPSGFATPATVTYDNTAKVATLTPSSSLVGNALYTAQIQTTVTADDGSPLPATFSWTFTTSSCPCTLFSSTAVPALVNLPVQDGRSGPGPFSYELGVKVKVDVPMLLSALRFYKSSQETGVHTGRVWTTGGVQLASVTFANESASGWQQQQLATPLALDPGVVYVLSVNMNAFFGLTSGGLLNPGVSGP